MPVRLGRVSEIVLDLLVREAPGYHVDRVATVVDSFERAADGLRAWAAHAGARARVAPEGAPIVVGQDVVVAFRIFPITVIAPCRIVWVVGRRA